MFVEYSSPWKIKVKILITCVVSFCQCTLEGEIESVRSALHQHKKTYLSEYNFDIAQIISCLQCRSKQIQPVTVFVTDSLKPVVLITTLYHIILLSNAYFSGPIRI